MILPTQACKIIKEPNTWYLIMVRCRILCNFVRNKIYYHDYPDFQRIKNNENRVALTPAGVAELVREIVYMYEYGRKWQRICRC